MPASTAKSSASDQAGKLTGYFAEISNQTAKFYLDGYKTYLDRVEKTVQDVTNSHRAVAERSNIKGVKAVVNRQADLATYLARVATAVGRRVAA